MPSLILIKAPGGSTAGAAYALTAGTTVIGREDICDIVIPNHAVSRKHAQIIRRGTEYAIEDLKSRNHTYINSKEVSGTQGLKHDDRIKICDFLFRYHDERAAPGRKPDLTGFAPPPAAEAEDDGGGLSTIEHTMPARSTSQLLDTQPADKIRALLDISANLSKTVELDPLLNQIADTLLQTFRQADRCFVILVEEGDRLVTRVVRTRKSAAAGTDDHRFSRTIVRKCMNSKESYLSEDASGDAALGAAQSIAEFRIRSVMCVPLITSEGQAIGAIQLDSQDRSKKFKEDDLKLLSIMANLAAVAIDRAKFHEQMLLQQKQQKEIELAAQVQRGFLPQTVPQLPGYEFFSYYSPALTVGGDYFDFIPMPGGRIAVVLGDVAGKGVPASLLMAKLSAEARYCLLTQPTLPAAVMLLNEQLIVGGIGDRFVTLAAVVIDPAANRAVIVNAGHINPAVFNAHKLTYEDVVTNAQSGIPLGIMSGFEYEAVEITLDVGDTIVLFTDGVSDATGPSGEMFGMDGVPRVLTEHNPLGAANRPKTVGERAVHAVRKHANGRPQNDDIAVVTCGRLDPALGPATGSSSSHHLPVLDNIRGTAQYP